MSATFVYVPGLFSTPYISIFTKITQLYPGSEHVFFDPYTHGSFNDISPSQIISTLTTTVESLLPARRVVLVGHSLGCVLISNLPQTSQCTRIFLDPSLPPTQIFASAQPLDPEYSHLAPIYYLRRSIVAQWCQVDYKLSTKVPEIIFSDLATTYVFARTQFPAADIQAANFGGHELVSNFEVIQTYLRQIFSPR